MMAVTLGNAFYVFVGIVIMMAVLAFICALIYEYYQRKDLQERIEREKEKKMRRIGKHG